MLYQLCYMRARATVEHRTRTAARLQRAIDRRIAVIGGWA